MTTTMFILLLTIGSVGSGLLTEAIKTWCKNANKGYSPNIIALINSAVFGIVGGVLAYLSYDIPFTADNIIMLVGLTLCDWIGCMIGYDKVIQSINQIVGSNNNEYKN